MTGILIDWGTTNARAYRLDDRNRVTGRRRLGRDIRTVPPGGFAAALDELLGPWVVSDEATSPILMCGMVGSRQGWLEAPYLSCPARLDMVAHRLCPVPGRPDLRIVPGICRSGGGRPHDVMRGEEVQVFGAALGEAPRVLCLPGTHSKWVRREAGVVVDFATAMTGELFQVLRHHSILGALMPPERDDRLPATLAGPGGEAFRHGLARAGELGGLLHHLFGVRAEGLFDAVPPEGLESYLSGLLIGHEIRCMAALFPSDAPVVLVAEGALGSLYEAAFHHLGRAVEPVDSEAATIGGLVRILEQAPSMP